VRFRSAVDPGIGEMQSEPATWRSALEDLPNAIRSDRTVSATRKLLLGRIATTEGRPGEVDHRLDVAFRTDVNLRNCGRST
jgi:hypothetical protein